MYCDRRIVKNLKERHPDIECDVYEGFLISVIDCIYYDMHHMRSSYFDRRLPGKLSETEEKEAEKHFYAILDNFKISWQRDKEIIEKRKRDSEGILGRVKSFFKKSLPKEDFLRDFREAEPDNSKVSWREMENYDSVFESGLLYWKKGFKEAVSELEYRPPMEKKTEHRPTRYDYLDEYMEAVFNYLEVLNIKQKFEEIRTGSDMDRHDLLRLPVQAMMDVDSWGNRNEVMDVFNRIVSEKRMEEDFVDGIMKKK